MMTALIKMEQIEGGCATKELYNYLPQQAFVLQLAFHQDRQIGEGRRRVEEVFQLAAVVEKKWSAMMWMIFARPLFHFFFLIC